MHWDIGRVQSVHGCVFIVWCRGGGDGVALTSVTTIHIVISFPLFSPWSFGRMCFGHMAPIPTPLPDTQIYRHATHTLALPLLFCTVQQYGAAIERCWHLRISLKIGIYTTHHLVTVNMCAKPTLSASALVWRAVEIASEWCWQSEWERVEVMETERGTKIWRVAPDSYGKWLWRLTAAVASTKVVWVRKAVIWMQHDSLSVSGSKVGCSFFNKVLIPFRFVFQMFYRKKKIGITS